LPPLKAARSRSSNEQRRRDKKHREENLEKYGKARRPIAAADGSRIAIKSARTPRTEQAGRSSWVVAEQPDGEAAVERELGYDEA
jgi:hypothetical protein